MESNIIGQRLQCRFRFKVEHTSLQMNPGSVDSGLKVHIFDKEVQYYLGDRRPEPVASTAAQYHFNSFLSHDQGRGHHGWQPPLPWPLVKTLGIQIFLTKHIVQHDTHFRDDVSAAFTIGGGNAGGIALLVQNAHMCGGTPGSRILFIVECSIAGIE